MYREAAGGWDSLVDWLSVDIWLSVWFLEMQNVCQNTVQYHVLTWGEKKMNKWWIFLWFCFVKEENDVEILCQVLLMGSMLFSMCWRCRLFPFLFRWVYFLCVTVWCLMIVGVFLSHQTSFRKFFVFFYCFSSTFTNRWLLFGTEKKISKHPKMYKSLFIYKVAWLSEFRTKFVCFDMQIFFNSKEKKNKSTMSS